MQDRERDSDDNRFIHHTLVCIESASSGKRAYAGIRHLPPDGNQIESVKTEDWNDNDKEIILTYAEHKQMDMVYPFTNVSMRYRAYVWINHLYPYIHGFILKVVYQFALSAQEMPYCY